VGVCYEYGAKLRVFHDHGKNRADWRRQVRFFPPPFPIFTAMFYRRRLWARRLWARRLWARRLWARRRRGAERRVLRAPPEAPGENQVVGFKYEKLAEGGVFEATATVLFDGTGIHPGGQAPFAGAPALFAEAFAGAPALFMPFIRLRLLRIPF
jgi:hypothetical protein